MGGVTSLLLALWQVVLSDVKAPWPTQLGAAAILFFASWIHSRDWLEERWTWRAWLRFLLAVVIPSVMLVLILEALKYPVCQTIRDVVFPRL